ncbi:transposase domain-containing protein [Clostridium cochlearium]|uniref:transposase domain-containing protein n=1 Tax=Clostridium cochlearium TaxID=1494 RepID=UPI0022DF6080|nr:transposase domain-containing protein [Clostridium cochlearium]
METAKANNLVVERYLVYLFDNLSKIDIKDSESLENLMPWSYKITENIKIKEIKLILVKFLYYLTRIF